MLQEWTDVAAAWVADAAYQGGLSCTAGQASSADCFSEVAVVIILQHFLPVCFFVECSPPLFETV
jgi:hypothetical protein